MTESFEEQQAKGIEEEKAYGDSATAVSPDTQQPAQGEGSQGSFGGESAEDGFTGEAGRGGSSRGQSTVFGEPQGGEQQGETSYGHDQDAEPPQPTEDEPARTESGGEVGAESPSDEDQDAAPAEAPYEQ